MAQGDKSAFYQALKKRGYSFDRHYREYTTDELKAIWDSEVGGLGEEPPAPAPRPQASAVPPKQDELSEVREELAQLASAVSKLATIVTAEDRRAESGMPPQPQAPQPPQHEQLLGQQPGLDPREHAGATLNSHGGDEVLRIDEHGNKWYQIEVPKPSFHKPRARRVLKYMDPGTKRSKIMVDGYVEEFEVAGDMKSARPAEIKVTMPSFQTGIYQAPNMPFRIHTYQGARGFNLDDVRRYYGGKDLVPSTIKKVYVSNDLCYDITTTIRAIENEYRERVLRTGKGL